MTSLAGAMAGARFFGRLPFYLRRRLTVAEARALQAARLRRREERFLDRVRVDIFDRPGSIYERLFRNAGWEYGDVEAGVRAGGVEAVLKRLWRAGVYLSVDEFKGRKPVVRGSVRIETAPGMCRSPRAAYHLAGSSGGSRSAGTPVLMDLAFVRDCASNSALCLDAWGGSEWRKGDWETPGAGARFRLLKYAAFGRPPEAWFSQVRPDDPSLQAVVRWNIRAMRWSSALAGRRAPLPVYAPVSDPTLVARWLQRVLREGETPHLFTFPGSAVRACVAAAEQGIDIAGARFTLSGEPITKARLDTIRKAGCTVIPRYGTVETGAVGYGCLNGEHPDDLHLVSDMHAVIQAGEHGDAAGLPPSALLLTELHERSPFLMLNLSMGDQAVLRRRDCGCPLRALGWEPHLFSIRSFEKLTGGGVTFLGTDIIRVLEEVLPAQFGGKPTDFQLAEKETPDGQPLLVLLAHPSLGPLDEARIVDVFYSAISDSAPYAAAMAQRWRDAKTLQVERRAPVISQAGKILHLHTGGNRAG